MVANQKEFYGGVGLMGGFLVVLIMIFLPLYQGQNGLNFLDNLFNSISKGSAYYIPKVKDDVAKSLAGKTMALDLKFENEVQAGECVQLFTKGGATAIVEGANLKVSGDLDQIMANCLDDADTLFHNKSEVLQGKYGQKGRQVLYNWWVSLKAMQKSLNKNEQFKEAKVVYTVMTKAVECAYNYEGIEAQSMTSRMGVVVFALVFYVVYTLWYGYAIMFMFEGWGLKISH
ncbi:MAG: hypothetical protein Q7U02_00460 [Desulfosalsimonadaceae bacterium]|nr:hypothetical protein [Desulfosalsimonadaceae bacterium]